MELFDWFSDVVVELILADQTISVSLRILVATFASARDIRLDLAQHQALAGIVGANKIVTPCAGTRSGSAS